MVQEPLSLETPTTDEEDGRLGDFIAEPAAGSPFDAVLRHSLRDRTRAVLKTLTPREEEVIRLRFGVDADSPHTLEEVGRHFAVTRERIRQIETRALRKLRRPARRRALESFQEGHP